MVWFVFVLLGFWVIYVVRDVLVALLFAVIIASAIEPAIVWLKERRIPRIFGVLVVYCAIAAIVFFGVYLVFPVVFDEIRTISFSYPAIQDRVLSGFDRAEGIPFTSLLQQNLEEFFSVPSQYLSRVSASVVDFGAAVFGGVFGMVVAVVFSFYLALQERGIEGFLRLIVPLEQEPYVIDLWGRAQKKLGRWVRAQVLLGAIVGVFIFFGLTLLGVEHALFFAILAALLEVIPVAGPILAAVPAVAATFFVSPILAVFTVLLYVAVQQVESHVIVPVVMRQAVGLSPLIVVLALLIGAKIGGIAGILLAVPITAVVAEVLNDWDKKKRSLLPD